MADDYRQYMRFGKLEGQCLLQNGAVSVAAEFENAATPQGQEPPASQSDALKETC